MLVDDETSILLTFETELRSAGITNTMTCSDSREVIALVSRQAISALLLDLSMPYKNGEEILETMAEAFPEVPVIVVTGNDDVETAVRCMKSGALDYLVKPVEKGLLPACVKRAIRFRDLNDEIQDLRQRLLKGTLDQPQAFAEIVTRDENMLSLFKYMEAVAKTAHPILITGETGVGKELIARAIHDLSERSGTLVTVNVAGLDDHVFADTLFGHLKGAFTGADTPRKGVIHEAAGGTLFLDEIGDLALPSQVKLLRLIQEGEYLQLGSDRPLRTDTRIITATNQDLNKSREKDAFRNDLYYRLKTHHIHVPPLRERTTDIPLLVDHFLTNAANELSIKPPTVPKELFDVLAAYSFPGNVRELEAMVDDAVSIHHGGILSTQSFRTQIGQQGRPFESSHAANDPRTDNPFDSWIDLPTLKGADTLLMAAALSRANNNLSVAARILGISKQALGKRLKRSRKE